jgi:Xaa-Pro dipeptidase
MATAIKSHQVNEIKYSSQFEDHMRELLASFTHFAPLIHTLPPNALFPELKLTPALLASLQPTPDKDATAGVAALTDAYLLPALHRTRLIKDGPEIELIRRANKISSDAHEVVMRVLGAAVRDQEKRQQTKERRPLLPGEWMVEREEEAEAIFVASCRREG